MCKFDFFFHSCGHTNHHYKPGPNCDPANWCTRPGPLNTFSWRNAFVVPEMCRRYCSNGKLSDLEYFSSYVDVITGMMVVLNRDIRLLKENGAQGKTFEVACEAVELLGRIVEKYAETCVARPSKEDMQRFISFTARNVLRAKRNSQGHRRKIAKNAAQNAAKKLNPESSAFVPSRVDSVVSMGSTNGAFGHQLDGLKVSIAAAAAVGTATPPEIKNAEESYDQFENLCQALYKMVAAESFPEEETHQHPEDRDQWECDFCGPECFCMNLL